MIFADESKPSGPSTPSNLDDFTQKAIPDIFISFSLQPNQTDNIGRFSKLQQEWNCERNYDQDTTKSLLFNVERICRKIFTDDSRIITAFVLMNMKRDFATFTAFVSAFLRARFLKADRWPIGHCRLGIETF
jgi:hypothetical protein